MYDRVIPENDGRLSLFLTATKIKNMYNKAVDDYPHALKSISDCLKTQKTSKKLSILILLQCKYFLNTKWPRNLL